MRLDLTKYNPDEKVDNKFVNDPTLHRGEQYPVEIAPIMDKAETSLERGVGRDFSSWNKNVLRWAEGIVKDTQASNNIIKKNDSSDLVIPSKKKLTKELESFLSEGDFDIDLKSLAIPMQTATTYAFDGIRSGLGGNSIANAVMSSLGVTFDMQYDMVLYRSILAERQQELAGMLYDTTIDLIPEVITRGIEEGLSIVDISKDLETVLGVNKVRAKRIARSEVNYAINEAIRQQTHKLGIRKYMIDAAPDACDLCRKRAEENVYTYAQSSGLLPVHPNCRCVLKSVIPEEWLVIEKSLAGGRVPTVMDQSAMDFAKTLADKFNKVILKGEKGDSGTDGKTPIQGEDYLTKSELKMIKNSVRPIKGEDYFTENEGEEFKKAITPKKGEDYRDGVDASPEEVAKELKEDKKWWSKLKGDRGLRGYKGKDGSPDTSEEIRDKLSELKGKERLDAKYIKNIERQIEVQLSTINLDGVEVSSDGRVRVDSTDELGYLEDKLVAGSNVTLEIVAGKKVKINATGGGAGAVDSVNGQTGVVVLGSDDIAEGSVNLYLTTAERNKLTGIEAGAEVNVQSDWTETDTGVDSYIKNKPSTILEGVVAGNDIDVDNTDPANPVVSLEDNIDLDTIQFNTSFSDGVAEGRLQWNTEDGTLEVGLQGGNVNMQIGQETLIKVSNKTGSAIGDGVAVYVSGANGSRPTIEKLDVTVNAIANAVAGVTTESIADNGNGYVTALGLVRDVDTSSFAAGDILYGSETVPGGFQNTSPTAPNTVVGVGICLFSNATSGVIGVYPRILSILASRGIVVDAGGYFSSDDIEGVLQEIGSTSTYTKGLLNGLSIERQSLTVVVSGTSVYLDVEAIGGGDIDYWVDDVKYALDCTTGSGVSGKARIELTQGTAIQPQANLAYVSYSEQESELVLSTTPPESTPDGSYAPVAIVTIQDYTSVTTNGSLVLQRTTETVQHDGKGAISWEREKLRALGAQYWSGIDQSVDITTNPSSEDNINFSVTGGTVFQLHRQQLDDVDISADGIMVANASGDGTLTNFQKFTDLNEIHEIADGTALVSGDCINIVIWGSVNYGGENKLFVNLPNDKYTNSDNAELDTKKTAITAIPPEFRTTGYLIAKLVLKYTSANGGTWENLLSSTEGAWHTGWRYWDTTNYPSNYNNNEDLYLTSTITEVGATAIRMVFDEFNTEANYDFIRLRNASGTNIFSYHGNLGAFTSANLSGDTIRVWFHSDGSVTKSGVRSNKYEYFLPGVAGQAVIDLRGIPTGFNLGASGGSASPVDSVFGRNGAVVAQSGDYEASEVTNAFDKTVDNLDDITDGSVYVKSENNFTDTLKTKLDNIEAGAEVNLVDSVNGETGVVVLTTGDLTEDTDKNYVTDSEKTIIGNTSGTNTGDMSNADVKTAYEANVDTNAFDDTEQTKLGHVTITQAVDLDTLESDTATNTTHRGLTDNPHTVTKTQVGLSNVTNDEQIPLSQKGANSGVAELDSGGKVPTAQLPAYVDDVIEAADYASLPTTGETGKIYITLDDNKTYRWSGTVYVEISASLALGETDSTAYRGDRGKIAYDHSQLISGNPHVVLATEISDFDTEVGNNSAVVLNTAKITYPSGDSAKVGYLTVTQAVDLDTMESDIATNNAKVTNATHTGEVAGSVVLTIADNIIDEANLKLDTAPTNDYILTADDTKSGGMKWKAPTGGGNVSTSGTPVVNDFAKFVSATDIEGRSYSEVKVDLGLEIGTDIQAWDEHLDDLAALTPGTEGKMITSDGLGGYQISTLAETRGYLNVEDGAEANNISDTDAVDLTDAGDSSLHYHSTDRARANHTGTQLASTISDFDTEVSNNSDVSANSSARHDAVTIVDSNSVDLTLTGQQIEADVKVDGVGLEIDITNGVQLKDLGVKTAKINDSAVTNAKINDGAVSILKISSGAKSGADSTLITGTAGTNGNVSQFNVDGDLVDGGILAVNIFDKISDDLDDISDGAVYVKSHNDYTDTEKTKLGGIEVGAEVNLVDSVNTQTGVVVLDADDISDTTTTNKFVTAGDLTNLGNLSGTNTGDQDISGIATNASDITDLDDDKADKVNVLELDNTLPYNPTTDYHPATKKYVDDNAGGAVDSVNGETGVVVLNQDDIGDGATYVRTENNFDDLWLVKLTGIEAEAERNDVDSVNTQTGAVVLDADDIDDTSTTNKFVTAGDLTNLGNLSGTNTGDQDLSGYFNKSTDDLDDISDGAVYVKSHNDFTDVYKGYLNQDVKSTASPTFAGMTMAGDIAGGTYSLNNFWDLGLGGDITVAGTVDGRDVATDGVKLDAIESNADVTDAVNIASSIHGVAGKTTPVDADEFALIDSAASNVLKKLTLANLKAVIKSYYDSVTATMTNKTLTSPVLNTGVSGTAVLDEDDMTSDSATKLATQQSIKAYSDNTGAGNSGGWIPITDTYAIGTDSQGLDVITIVNNDINYLSVGMRIKVTQSSTVYYGIVHKIQGDVVDSYVSVFLSVDSGTRDRLDGTTITNLYYSRDKCPFGFPNAKSSWSLTSYVTSQSETGASGTIYEVDSYTIPLGCWDVAWAGTIYAKYSSYSTYHYYDLYISLTSASASVYNNFTMTFQPRTSSAITYQAENMFYMSGFADLDAEDTLYFNAEWTYSGTLSDAIVRRLKFTYINSYL